MINRSGSVITNVAQTKNKTLPNPYKSPFDTPEATGCQLETPTARSSFVTALATSAIFSFIGIAIHKVCGIPLGGAILENQVWVLLLSALLTIVLVIVSSRLSMAGKFTCSITGLTVLIYHLFEIATTLANAIPVERFAFYHRVLGEYYWVYWAVVLVLGVLPLAFWASKICRSVLASLSLLCVIAAVSAFFLRSNFVVKYADSLPTSWRQFFLPF